jgi:hypothetical protein
MYMSNPKSKLMITPRRECHPFYPIVKYSIPLFILYCLYLASKQNIDEELNELVESRSANRNSNSSVGEVKSFDWRDYQLGRK